MPTLGRLLSRLARLSPSLRSSPPGAAFRVLEGAPAFDVGIVGSGPAGAALGLDLVTRGHRVLMVEAGARRERGSAPRVLLDGYRVGGGDYPVASSRYRGPGGTSNLWLGACPRLHPLDFQPNAYTPEGAAWPIQYADLAPYYDRAERTLRSMAGACRNTIRPGARISPSPPSRTARRSSR